MRDLVVRKLVLIFEGEYDLFGKERKVIVEGFEGRRDELWIVVYEMGMMKGRRVGILFFFLLFVKWILVRVVGICEGKCGSWRRENWFFRVWKMVVKVGRGWRFFRVIMGYLFLVLSLG